MQSQTAVTAQTTPNDEAVVAASATREQPPLGGQEGIETSLARRTASAGMTTDAAAEVTAALVIGQAAATPTALTTGYVDRDPGLLAQDYEDGLDQVSVQQAGPSETTEDRFLVVFAILVLLATIGIFVVLFSHLSTAT